MKNVILTLLCALVTLMAAGQTQHGYVKTKGRRANNKLVAGTPLTGASIQVKGSNTVVSAAGGKFAIPVPSRKYYLQSVKKNGYVLIDPDILLKSYSYSSNPLVIVMETPEQKNEDVLSATRKIRRTLQRQIDAKEDRIEELMEQNKITMQQYREAMQALNEEQQKNGELISEMAEHYAQMDYDLMDEFNQQVNDLILEGKLTQADSLLRSKGDVNARIAQVQQEEAAQQAEAAQLKRRQQDLEASIAGTQAKKNDIAQDCYNYYKKFILEMEPDSALHYIEKRASIDPSNIYWQFEAGSYCQRRGLIQKADQYFQRTIDQARQLAQENPEEYEPTLAMVLRNAATLASSEQADVAASYFQESIDILDRLAASNLPTYGPFYASVLNNAAMFYSGHEQDGGISEQCYAQARDIYWQFAQENPSAYIPRVADVLNNMAQLHDAQHHFNESEQCYQQALGIYSQLAATSPQIYQANVAATLNNLSALYYRNGRNGEQQLSQAVEIYRQLDKEDPQRYGPLLAATLHNLAIQFYSEGRDGEGDDAYMQALDIYRLMSQQGSTDVKPELARRLLEQAIRLYQDDRIAQSVPLFQESLENYRELMKIDPDSHMADAAMVLRNLATALDKTDRLTEGEKMYQEELDLNLALAQKDPAQYRADVARSYGNLSNHALLTQDWGKAIDLASKGLAIDESKLFIQANLAAALLFNGETARAQEIYTRYKSQLHDVFLDDLQQFSSLGIIPKDRLGDVELIKRLLAN